VNILFLPAALIAAGAMLSWLLRKNPKAATTLGAGCCSGGAAAGLTLLIMDYCHGVMPGIQDLFAVPVLLLALLCPIHAIGYLAGHGSERSGSFWALFDLTAAAMLAVTMATTQLGFLVAWEIMGAASFGLVIFDRHNRTSWRAGWVYMMACHAGAALLILLFFFPHTPGWMFLLAVAGFGLKIGFPLLHVWLPQAHPAAPAPVSALMSGAMIELGFFGVLLFGISPDGNHAVYGWSFLILGLITAPCGIIFAIAQSNLKKLLAYSSIENMGILSCALGLGFLGAAYGLPEMMVSGLLGAATHLLNHALLKGGLFLGSGSVYKACGTLDMDEMGGLLKRMPRTGAYFILHALSLCGLPPGSGFAGEFLIYLAAFTGLSSTAPAVVAASAATLIILALTGGLAAAAFAKVIGAVFCGEPRSKGAQEAVDVPLFMNLPVMILQFLSWAVIFALPLFLNYAAQNIFAEFDFAILPLACQSAKVALICFILTIITLGVFALRQMMIRKTGQRISPTWGCGYTAPTSRMQYTATSFGQNPVDFFRLLLHPERKIERPQGIFPEKAMLEESVTDGGERCFWQKIFRAAGKIAEKSHALQSGSLHFYLLIMVLTLIGMLLFAVTQGN